MALMPKRVKHRKSQRGRIKGNATRGNRVVFGDFGLQATQGGWISAADDRSRPHRRLSSTCAPKAGCTSACSRTSRSRPFRLETRMGKGKGEPEYWAAVVKPGHGPV